ncbi:hypothetical protein [Mycolicibacterium sediminis]|uniref:Transmembrane protein n=1 Tax=Mycolicibacterium sediminis TaxID=1286180 RepID=A0A7I7QNN0_9MYCO|nr:hypothetical protein [Mycolicibacterium sediminis]BBY27885.1 hypothetical protein MSEDJ_19810 [Mycolicibacterium sediminis]
MAEHVTGEPTQNWAPLFDTGSVEAQTLTAPPPQPHDASSGEIPIFVPPEVVPGSYLYLKRWTFVLVVAGVWLLGAAAGGALYEWWFASLDKTAPVFVVLVYTVACAVAALLAGMIRERPLNAALALALMSAPLASVATAAVLYGSYVFGWFGR